MIRGINSLRIFSVTITDWEYRLANQNYKHKTRWGRPLSLSLSLSLSFSLSISLFLSLSLSLSCFSLLAARPFFVSRLVTHPGTICPFGLLFLFAYSSFVNFGQFDNKKHQTHVSKLLQLTNGTFLNHHLLGVLFGAKTRIIPAFSKENSKFEQWYWGESAKRTDSTNFTHVQPTLLRWQECRDVLYFPWTFSHLGMEVLVLESFNLTNCQISCISLYLPGILGRNFWDWKRHPLQPEGPAIRDTIRLSHDWLACVNQYLPQEQSSFSNFANSFGSLGSNISRNILLAIVLLSL